MIGLGVDYHWMLNSVVRKPDHELAESGHGLTSLRNYLKAQNPTQPDG